VLIRKFKIHRLNYLNSIENFISKNFYFLFFELDFFSLLQSWDTTGDNTDIDNSDIYRFICHFFSYIDQLIWILLFIYLFIYSYYSDWSIHTYIFYLSLCLSYCKNFLCIHINNSSSYQLILFFNLYINILFFCILL